MELIRLVIDLRLLCDGGGRDRVVAAAIVDHMISEVGTRLETRKETEGAFTAKTSHGQQTKKWGRKKISFVKSSLWRKKVLILF